MFVLLANFVPLSGKRVPQNVLDDLIARNGFEMITEEFFHDLLAERQEIMKAKMKFQG